jgi:hypothetical protein
MKKPRARTGGTSSGGGTARAPRPSPGSAKPTRSPAARLSLRGVLEVLLPSPRARLLAALATILGIQGVAMALVAIPAPHAGGDNAAYLTLARALLAGEGYTEFWDPFAPPHSKYPPAYPLLLATMMALGATTWSAFKALSAWLMMGAVAFVFLWVRERRGTAFAAVVALLTGLSGPWLEASRWVLSEPLFLVGVFMALWAGERIRGPGRNPSRGPGRIPSAIPGEAAPTTADRAPPAAGTWTTPALALTTAGVLLAFFTRTAALPLVMGFFLLLAYRRAWRPLVAVVAGTAVPVTLWILRGRAGGEGAYQDEFWMVDPYDPSLGLVGLGGFLARIASNVRIYVGEILGAAWWGADMAVPGVGMLGPRWIAALGIILAALALVGWGMRVAGRRVGLAEFFVPLYAGLILLWPEVWSGDRFLLPLYPLVLLWGGEALIGAWGWDWAKASDGARARARSLDRGSGWLGPAAGRVREHIGPVLMALLLGTLLAPAGQRIDSIHKATTTCRAVGAVDPWACYGPTHTHFRDAAEWAGIHLPADAVVINRKPRIFHLLGGVPGRVFPFDTRIEPLRELAAELGARYLLVDAVDGVSAFYLPPLVGGAPDHFCWMEQWGEFTAILVILSEEERAAFRADAEARGEDPMAVFPCGEIGGRVPALVAEGRSARTVAPTEIYGVVHPPLVRPRPSRGD